MTGDNEEEAAASSFPELEEKITAAIRRHGGAIFPKLNWSAPTGAAWVLAAAPSVRVRATCCCF